MVDRDTILSLAILAVFTIFSIWFQSRNTARDDTLKKVFTDVLKRINAKKSVRAPLDIVNQGAEAWEKWRLLTEPDHIEFGGADLSKAFLDKIDFASADLKKVSFWQAHLRQAILKDTDLREANLGEADLSGADLSGARLVGANLQGTNLNGANLKGTDLRGADLREAKLKAAQLQGANLTGVDLSEARLIGADLQGANLTYARLTGSDLRDANLSETTLVGTKIDQAKISGCSIYGINVWDLDGEFKEQKNLVISSSASPTITVDNIKIAQFIYLILNNEEIRDVLNVLTSKSVLILGRFSLPERKEILEALRNKLREFDLLPIVFDFDRPTDKDFTETIKTLAGLSYFVIADITNPKSSPLELQATVPDYQIPFVPIIQEGENPFAMMVDLQKKYNWVLKTVSYDSQETLMKVLKPLIIDPAMKKRQELRIIKAQKPEIISAKDYLAKGKE